MSDDIVVQGFDFFLEEDDGDWSKEWFSGGIAPANQEEIAMWLRIRSDAAEILSLRAELTEQARLVGMGAERELKLIAERDEARGEVAAIVRHLTSARDAYGKGAGWHALDRVITAISSIRKPWPLIPFEPANYIKTPEDLAEYREAAIEGEVAAIVAWLREGAMFAQAMADQVRNAASSNTLRSQADAFSTAATAIEARAYVKENDGD